MTRKLRWLVISNLEISVAPYGATLIRIVNPDRQPWELVYQGGADLQTNHQVFCFFNSVLYSGKESRLVRPVFIPSQQTVNIYMKMFIVNNNERLIYHVHNVL